MHVLTAGGGGGGERTAVRDGEEVEGSGGRWRAVEDGGERWKTVEGGVSDLQRPSPIRPALEHGLSR